MHPRARAATRRRPLLGLFAAVALFAAACGNDDDAEPVADDEAEPAAADLDDFPVEVEADNGTVTIEERPDQVVSLSPALTEILFATGAGDQVVAVDQLSDYPPEVPVSDLSGFEPNVEAITTFDPDLVVVSFDANDVVAGLEQLDIPVLEYTTAGSLDDTYRQIEALGAATGNAEAAEELVTQMTDDIEALVAEVPERDEPVSFFHEIDAELFTATSSSFIGQIYALADLENIADPADDGSGFPQVSSELVLEADPDVIFLADATGAGAEAVVERPGWDQLTAVQEDRIVELDPAISSRWGPRIVEHLRIVIEETADL